MAGLLEFLRTHDEAFRSRTRLASLYSDFRTHRSSNPEGYRANAAAWLRALSDAVRAGEGLSPSSRSTAAVAAGAGVSPDRLVLHSGEALEAALETPELGRPLALGAVMDEGVREGKLVPSKEFLNARESVYRKSWVPSVGHVVAWGLRQLGVGGIGGGDATGDFVVMANVEAAAKAVMDHAAKTATSNTSRVFSRDLFASTFASAVGTDVFTPTDLAVLLTHLSRDRDAIAYSPATGTIKFRAPGEAQCPPISEEDVSIASLRALISSLGPQVDGLASRVSELDALARKAVADKKPTAAKSALRSRKLADTTLQQRSATLAQLEEVYARIEQAADQVEMVQVMQASAKTLRSLNRQTGGVEKVQDVVEELREQMLDADEIRQAIDEVSAGQVDEAEVDDELEAMEKAEREKEEEAERERKEKEVERDAEETRKRLAQLDPTVTSKDVERADLTSPYDDDPKEQAPVAVDEGDETPANPPQPAT